MGGINLTATEEILKKAKFTHITDNAALTLTFLAGTFIIKDEKYRKYKIVFGARKLKGKTYKKHAFFLDESGYVVDPLGMLIEVDFEKIQYLEFIDFNVFEFIEGLDGVEGFFSTEQDRALAEALAINQFTAEGYKIVE